MAINKTEFSAYIKAFEFRELFNELGWNNDRTIQPIIIDDITYILNSVAEKSGFRIFVCQSLSGKKIPDSATRKKIEGKVTKLFQEHLIIFIDDCKNEQIWQLTVRKAGSPTKISETRYTILQDPELLYQRASGLFYTMEEEETITIVDVTQRVADNFQQNNERITKQFYENFKKEHTAFVKYISGIDDKDNLDWYASLMLNRLMFCYFIQKKKFLDNNKKYLRDKLNECKLKKGINNFYSFYRNFLLTLFHKGLGALDHDIKLEVEIGRVPYLNGGLFNEHEIEKTFKEIKIEDNAFERLFNFFDQYEWHLDTRESASGRDINPDVIGYIFEKYINDRSNMGAYYTKEDITDYISKNCIIPWLFDEVKRKYPKAFANDGWLWQMVKDSGDDYIYDAVKFGIPVTGGLFDDLPDEIKKGFVPELENKIIDGEEPWLWELRKEWNNPAPSEIALHTEIYREVIERRRHYAFIKSKIEKGEINEINDFITFNLNIRQFVQDLVEVTNDPEFINHFYQALSTVTILDPTCGSGAFLFAAMNILEPLYETSIQKMRNFIKESENEKNIIFEKIIANVDTPEHQNLQYFIYKSIILNNLYGVDIMKEAVEIAKLRLFLKLVATVDANPLKDNLGLEPLPDIDFNLRSGNTLVGYATKKQIDDIAGLFITDAHKKSIIEKCRDVSIDFELYKMNQLNGKKYDEFLCSKTKDKLNEGIKKLKDDLDGILYMQQYGGHTLDTNDYKNWRKKHQPFHWFAEFYEIIIGRNGFDVVIGNPPYVLYNPLNFEYKIKGYATSSCSNLYAYCSERSCVISNIKANIGLIVPLSLVSGSKFYDLRKLLYSNSSVYYSHYDIRPAKLFDGVDQRLTIFLKINADNIKNKIYSTKYKRWEKNTREYLFQGIKYCNVDDYKDLGMPKIGSEIEVNVLNKIKQFKNAFKNYSVNYKTDNCFYFRSAGGRYYLVFFTEPQKTIINNKTVHITAEKPFLLMNTLSHLKATAILSSTLFYIYFIYFSDARNLTKELISSVNIPDSIFEDHQINHLCNVLTESLNEHSIEKRMTKKNGDQITLWEIYPRQSKSIIDNIDCILANHYVFTHEELDNIINYDIKYRTTIDSDGNEEDLE